MVEKSPIGLIDLKGIAEDPEQDWQHDFQLLNKLAALLGMKPFNLLRKVSWSVGESADTALFFMGQPLSSEVRRQSGMKTGAVGLIHSAEHAESILANSDADIVILGRALLANPMWPLDAAKTLKKADQPWPIQYERSNIY